MAEDFCNNCGLCCMHMRTPPFIGVTDPRWQAMPQELRDELSVWLSYDEKKKKVVEAPRYTLAQRKYGDDLPCLWLNVATGKCRHYEFRPDVCRDYQPGNGSCRELRRSVGLTVKGMPVVYGD
jgi:Fe-S-cluster containining protein